MSWKSGIIERVMCERVHCRGGETIVVFPLVLTFAPYTVSQPLRNLTVKLTIDGLTRGYKFLVDNFLDVEKTINMNLTLLQTCAFFGLGEFGDFHCEDCRLVSGS
jgi:hypothetical protein